ncbi:MAG: hypothetical protein O3C01_06855 [Bacteroidetes bacterium]|nr:hypothetical protein [Bacteroidota bacterium]MDA1019432.1 hypothetical protein [Bacteroidota bacterium]
MNYLETSTISRQFKEEGYSLVNFEDFSNNYVRVKLPWRKNLIDNIVNCDLKKIDDDA